MNDVLAQSDLTGWLVHYATVLLRMIGLLYFLPIFGSQMIPTRMRFAFAAVLTVVFLPMVPRLDLDTTNALAIAVVAVRELSVGFGLGLAAKMIFSGVDSAAGLVAGQSGFALASMVDPGSGDQGLAPTIFQNLLTISLFLAADLHHLFIRAVIASYEVMPAAVKLPWFGSLDRMTSLMGMRLFTVAVELAAPALIVTISIDLVMGLVGRAMPQVPIVLVGYPFKLVAGLVAMAILATSTGATIGWIGRTVSSDGARIVGALAGS